MSRVELYSRRLQLFYPLLHLFACILPYGIFGFGDVLFRAHRRKASLGRPRDSISGSLTREETIQFCRGSHATRYRMSVNCPMDLKNVDAMEFCRCSDS